MSNHNSPKRLERYAEEFAGRQNVMELDTEQQMSLIARRIQSKQVKYEDSI